MLWDVRGRHCGFLGGICGAMYVRGRDKRRQIRLINPVKFMRKEVIGCEIRFFLPSSAVLTVKVGDSGPGPLMFKAPTLIS